MAYHGDNRTTIIHTQWWDAVIQSVDIFSVSSNACFCIEMACTLLIRHLLLRQTGNMMNVSSFYSFFLSSLLVCLILFPPLPTYPEADSTIKRCKQACTTTNHNLYLYSEIHFASCLAKDDKLEPISLEDWWVVVQATQAGDSNDMISWQWVGGSLLMQWSIQQSITERVIWDLRIGSLAFSQLLVWLCKSPSLQWICRVCSIDNLLASIWSIKAVCKEKHFRMLAQD